MEIILGKMGEMVLKGLNRRFFEDRMLKSLRHRLALHGSFRVYAAQSTVYIEPQDEAADMSAAFDKARRVFGLTAVCRAYACEKEMGAILAAASEHLETELLRARTFKVEAKRADKKFPLKSPEIARDVGEVLLNRFPHLKVDVIRPEVTVYVEVRDFAAYVHTNPVPGAGGLPVGTAGKAALMLSGGIDSPVAAQRMARRGLELEAIHFYSYPYTSERAKQKVITLTGILTNYIGRTPIHIVPFTRIQEEIRDKCPEDFFTLIMRRSMMRIVNRIAADTGCSAIITGECLGQVASQTIQALAATEDASALPVLRPLIGMDKEDIVRIAREIGTFETSILPYEDCCTVFTPKHPKTKPRIEEIRALEEAVDFDTLESEAVLNCERLVITHEQDG